MKKFTSTILIPNTITMIYFLLLPGISVSQLDIIQHEVDPGYAANYIAEDYEGNILTVSNNLVRKYNPTQGVYLWTTTILPAEGFSGYVSIHDMTIDANGNTYLTGWYIGSVAFGSTVLTSLINTNLITQKSDLFVSKLDPNGNFLWAKSLGTNVGTDRGYAIAVDGAGNVYITGNFCNKICSGPPQSSPPEIEDIYVAKLNNSGHLIWQKRFAPSKVICENGGVGHDITVDATGNIYATGWFQGTFKFGNTTALTLTSQGWGDVFTIKLNNTGTALWARAGKGAGSDRGLSLYVDTGGNINVGGYYGNNAAGNITFSPFILADVDGNAGAPGPSVSNAFLVQYTSSGNINWAINPAPVSGIHNEVHTIIGDPESDLKISMPSLGLKSYTAAGIETASMLMEDNFTMLDGYPYEKTKIRDLAASSSGFIFSMSTFCGTVPLANLAIQNQHCLNCADWYTCNAPSHSDLYIIRSVSLPAVNAPIVSRSIPEILGHTYLGTFNGHTYYMSDCPTTWYDALFAAEEMGGYLATITSQEEDEFLEPFAPYIECEAIYNGEDNRIGGAWIGLLTNDNDQDGLCLMTTWINGEEIGYTNWSPSYLEPISGYCGPAAIIGYIGGNYNLGLCGPWVEYRWFTNYYTNPTSKYIVEFDQDPACSQTNKTYVCHNGNTICINQSSLQGHLNHGDYAGPCSPCNANNATTPYIFENDDVSNDEHLPVRLELGDEGKVHFFPNPATNHILVDIRHLHRKAIIRIYLTTGEKVYEQTYQNEKSASIDVSSLPSGIILVEVTSENERWMKKIVKLKDN